MKTLNERITEVSRHLQTLTNPKYASEVEAAVKSEDKAALMKICNEAKIPAVYKPTVVSVLLSVSPQIKWPLEY